MMDGDLKADNLKNKKYTQYLDKADFLQQVLADQVHPKVEIVIHMGACSSTRARGSGTVDFVTRREQTWPPGKSRSQSPR